MNEDLQSAESTVDESVGHSVIRAEWYEEIPLRDRCANCGAPRESRFCSDCGQQHLHQRVHFGELLRSAISQLTDIDRGLLHTFLGMVKHPGLVAREYVSGRRKPYVAPLAYFSLGAACQLLTIWAVRDRISGAIRDSMPAEAIADNPQLLKMQEAFGGDLPAAIAEIYISTMQQSYSYAALLFFCMPLAFLLAWLHRFTGTRFHVGETMVFSMFHVGQMLIYTAIVVPLTLVFVPSLQAIPGPLIYLLVMMQGHTEFFARGRKSRTMTVIAVVTAAAVFFASIIAIFAGSFVVHFLLARAANG